MNAMRVVLLSLLLMNVTKCISTLCLCCCTLCVALSLSVSVLSYVYIQSFMYVLHVVILSRRHYNIRVRLSKTRVHERKREGIMTSRMYHQKEK